MSPKPDEYLGCTNGNCDIERPRGMDRDKRRRLREARTRDRTRIAELEAKLTEERRRLDTALAGWA